MPVILPEQLRKLFEFRTKVDHRGTSATSAIHQLHELAVVERKAKIGPAILNGAMRRYHEQQWEFALLNYAGNAAQPFAMKLFLKSGSGHQTRLPALLDQTFPDVNQKKKLVAKGKAQMGPGPVCLRRRPDRGEVRPISLADFESGISSQKVTFVQWIRRIEKPDHAPNRVACPQSSQQSNSLLGGPGSPQSQIQERKLGAQPLLHPAHRRILLRKPEALHVRIAEHGNRAAGKKIPRSIPESVFVGAEQDCCPRGAESFLAKGPESRCLPIILGEALSAR